MRILRLIFLILHLGILFLLMGMLLNAYVPPQVFPWFNLLSLGFPVLITAYILLTVFWVLCRKKRAVIFILVGLMLISPIKRWINFSPVAKETSDLEIITFNAKAGQYGINDIEEYVNSKNADIVFLQETGLKEYKFKNLEKGNNRLSVVATFSKYKILDQKDLIKSDYETNNAYASQIDIEIKGKVYRLINVYLQPFKFEKKMMKLNGNNEEDERKLKNVVKRLISTFKMHQDQIDSIREGIENSPYPVILAGDFNSVPSSYEYYHLLDGLQDVFAETGNGSATSFHDYRFPIRIDYVFTSKSIKSTGYNVDRSVKLSDHYPVIATFKLEN